MEQKIVNNVNDSDNIFREKRRRYGIIFYKNETL